MLKPPLVLQDEKLVMRARRWGLGEKEQSLLIEAIRTASSTRWQ